MAPFAGLAVFVTVHIEPLVLLWVQAGFHGLEAAIATIDEELAQRIVTDDAFDAVGGDLVAEAEGHHFVVVAVFACFGRLGTVLKAARRHKGRVVELGVWFAFREAVMGTLPFGELVGVAFAAGLGAGVLGEGRFLIRHHIGISFREGDHHRGGHRRVFFLRPQGPCDQGHHTGCKSADDHHCLSR